MKNTIKVRRAEKDMTQEELANILGIARQTVIAIEKEKYSPSLELAFKISRLFHKNIEEIFIYDKEEKK
ncbi:MAG: helix-turn-helix transcriptional regulator [Spirochaetia bacterium]|nr:helix-turn-helix transcriptional regulator [Spirochaetia bacterium]